LLKDVGRAEQSSSHGATQRASLWTILATLAGVIGAAAAVYPLFPKDQQPLHLVLDAEGAVRAETFSEPVVLTGNWEIRARRLWRKGAVLFERGRDPFDVVGEIRDRRISTDAKERAFVAWVHFDGWREVERCTIQGSEFELRLEFTSRGGPGWANVDLPICSITPERRQAIERSALQAAKDREEARIQAIKNLAEAEAAIKRGEAHAANGEYRRAISEFSYAIKLGASDPDIYSKRGDAYQALGQGNLALEDYSTSFRIRCTEAKWQPEPCRHPK
jgi:hypothetical protein